jgi:hypothetical protein
MQTSSATRWASSQTSLDILTPPPLYSHKVVFVAREREREREREPRWRTPCRKGSDPRFLHLTLRCSCSTPSAGQDHRPRERHHLHHHGVLRERRPRLCHPQVQEVWQKDGGAQDLEHPLPAYMRASRMPQPQGQDPPQGYQGVPVSPTPPLFLPPSFTRIHYVDAST